MKKPTWLLKLEYGMAHQPPKKKPVYETVKSLSKKPETYILSLFALAASFTLYTGHHNLSLAARKPLLLLKRQSLLATQESFAFLKSSSE